MTYQIRKTVVPLLAGVRDSRKPDTTGVCLSAGAAPARALQEHRNAKLGTLQWRSPYKPLTDRLQQKLYSAEGLSELDQTLRNPIDESDSRDRSPLQCAVEARARARITTSPLDVPSTFFVH